MTDPTAWPNPDRPGVPLNPERDGWHWVSRPMHGVLPMQWLEIAGGGWAGDMICILASEAARMNWRYLGLCLTPAEVAAAVQAEREACAAAVESRAAAIDHKECCGFPAPSYGPPECCCEPVLMISDRDAAGAIRARGPADALAEAQKAAYCEGWNDRESDFLAGVDRTGMVVVSADALAQARREGMEAAARIVESVSEWQGQDYYCDSCKGGAIYPDREDVAAKIRSAAGEGGK